MTATTSPFFIEASSSSSVPSTIFRFHSAAKAPFSWPDAGVPSRSANPIDRSLLPPVKIDPNSNTKISGKASVQKRAARSRVKLLMLATVRRSSGRIGRSSVPQRPAGEVEEDVLEGGPPHAEIRGLDAEALGRVEDRPDRPGHVPGIEQRVAVLVLDGGDARHPAEPLLGQAVDRVEPDRPFLEPTAHQLLDRALLEDVAVIHDRDAVA